MPLFRVHMPPEDELLPALRDVLYSGYIGQGEKAAGFEAAFASWLGAPAVLAVNSGTSAIQLALRLAGVRGGSVVSTPVTCTATNMPILAEGGRIIWADVDPAAGNIDPADVARKIEPDTRAILAVHWGGQPCDMTALNGIGRQHGIPVIEDAAHALGAEWDGRRIGAGTADFTCFSLQAIKHITTVDGGVLACRNPQDLARGRLLRWYGIDRETGLDGRLERDVPEWGYKWHMNDVTATIGLAQLPYLDGVLRAHRANAAHYAARLAVPHAGAVPGAVGAWWLFTLLLDDAGERDRFAKHMDSVGIGVSRVHTRNDTHTCFAPFAAGPLPGVDEFTARMCCIPVHSGLSVAERDRVARAVRAFWGP